MFDKTPYLTPSPFQSDDKKLVGKDPSTLTKKEVEGLPGPKSLTKAVREFCIECSGGNEAEARKCVAVTCQLWPFRMGKNVFRSKGISPGN